MIIIIIIIIIIIFTFIIIIIIIIKNSYFINIGIIDIDIYYCYVSFTLMFNQIITDIT